MNTSRLQFNKDTLLIIPSSKSQSRGSEPSKAVSFLSSLSPENAAALTEARIALRQRAHIDESTRMPAYHRFKGTLYEQCSEAIGKAISAGRRILIVSGAYGLLHADEPIGFYERNFSATDWPPGLLGRCIFDYIKSTNIRSVIAIASYSTNTTTLIRNMRWKMAGVNASLVTPNASGSGVLTKVPRAQGEVIRDLIAKGIEPSWLSSDSLSLRIESL